MTRAICGGAQVHLLELLGGIGPDFQYAIAVGAEGYLTAEARRLGAEVFVMPDLVEAPNPVQDWRAITEARKLIHAYRPDIVHAHSSKAGIIGRIAAHRAGVPALFTAHGWAFSDDRPLVDRMVGIPAEWIGARMCQRIVTVCTTDRHLCLKHNIAPASKIDVIYNGISDSDQRAQPDSGNAVTVAMVARFDQQKDQALLLEVMPSLPRNTRLIFVGDGPSRPACEVLAQKLGVAQRVLFMGTSNNVASILSEANIFVLASNWEGLPLSILEAMRAGLPVIATDVGGVSEAVIHDQSGFLVPRANQGALQASLCRLIESPRLRAEMGQFGRRRFADVFTAERMVGAVRDLYHSLAGSLN